MNNLRGLRCLLKILPLLFGKWLNNWHNYSISLCWQCMKLKLYTCIQYLFIKFIYLMPLYISRDLQMFVVQTEFEGRGEGCTSWKKGKQIILRCPKTNTGYKCRQKSEMRVNILVKSDSKHCCFSVTKLCPTLCDPMKWRTPGFPVLHYFPVFALTHVVWVSDAI